MSEQRIPTIVCEAYAFEPNCLATFSLPVTGCYDPPPKIATVRKAAKAAGWELRNGGRVMHDLCPAHKGLRNK